MNPSYQLLLILISTLEITFTKKLLPNLIIIIITILYLMYKNLPARTWWWILAAPIIPGLAILVTIGWFGSHNIMYAWILVSRIYVYILTGTAIVKTHSTLTLTRSLEQNLHLPPKYAYGVLAALNLISKTIENVQKIKQAAAMRGVILNYWSPQLYFKAILTAIHWSDELAQAMESHGFNEVQSRTVSHAIAVKTSDWWLLIGGLIILQLLLIFCPV